MEIDDRSNFTGPKAVVPTIIGGNEPSIVKQQEGFCPNCNMGTAKEDCPYCGPQQKFNDRINAEP